MEKSKHRSPRRVPTWFDRINRYRASAAFLFVPFLLTLFAWVVGIPVDVVMPMVARRSVYWVGLFLLTVALAMDAWEVYSGKRQVKRMIEARIRQDTD